MFFRKKYVYNHQEITASDLKEGVLSKYEDEGWEVINVTEAVYDDRTAWCGHRSIRVILRKRR